MTFIRRIPNPNTGNNYVYEVRSYREKGTQKVKQETVYLGIEVEKDGKKEIIPPKRKRSGLREILDYGTHMALHKVALEFRLPEIIQDSLALSTRIENIGTKIVILAINKISSDMTIRSVQNWFSRSSLKERVELTSDDFTPKKVRGILDLLSESKPDVSGIIEGAITNRIKELFPEDLDVAVYDLTALTYHGDENDLAQYGHAYKITGEKQINMVLGVTLKNKLPLHHKTLPGKIVSVSTIHSFVKELKLFGIQNVVLILDRGFYSKRNINEIIDAEYDVIGALASHLKITKNALTKSVKIENSRNLLRYPKHVIFSKEYKEDDFRVIVYHDVEKKDRQIKSFYEGLAEVQNQLEEISDKKFDTAIDLDEELKGICGNYRTYFGFKFKKYYSRWKFTYNLKHKSIQRTTNKFGKTVLFTTTDLNAADVLKAYREKDVIEKTFQLMKKRGLTPINCNKEESTRSRIMLSYIGYLMLSLLRTKLDDGTSLGSCLTTLEGVREVSYTDGSKELPELTKLQKEIMEMVGLM